jgi:hypothetical protein
MTRNQRRKLARKRWEAKATALVEAHHAWVRHQTVKANLANPHRPERSGALASHAQSWAFGFSARGANGKATTTTDNSFVVKPKRR